MRGVAPRIAVATATALLRQRFIMSPSHCGSDRLVRTTTGADDTPRQFPLEARTHLRVSFLGSAFQLKVRLAGRHSVAVSSQCR